MDDIIELIGEDINGYQPFSEQYKFQAIIGKGAFGIVIKALEIKTNQECAIKIILRKNMSPQDLNVIQSESNILSQLKHPNIVKFKSFFQTPKCIMIVMELVQCGSLRDLMIKRSSQGQWFTESECQIMLLTLLKTIAYIHAQNIVHRDLKPENILIADQNDFSTIKIGDFGLSAAFNQESRQAYLQKQCGTLLYMAPELLEGRVYGKSVDIWSVGVIMYLLLCQGEHPYYQDGDRVEMLSVNIKKVHSAASNLSENQKSLFTRLIMVEPLHRYTAHQCLAHPWLNNENDGDVPQTTQEIFLGWKLGQKLSFFLKAVIALQALGWEPPKRDGQYTKKCQELEQNKKKHSLDHYDKIFKEYEEDFKQFKQKQEERKKTPPIQKTERWYATQQLLQQYSKPKFLQQRIEPSQTNVQTIEAHISNPFPHRAYQNKTQMTDQITQTKYDNFAQSTNDQTYTMQATKEVSPLLLNQLTEQQSGTLIPLPYSSDEIQLNNNNTQIETEKNKTTKKKFKLNKPSKANSPVKQQTQIQTSPVSPTKIKKSIIVKQSQQPSPTYLSPQRSQKSSQPQIEDTKIKLKPIPYIPALPSLPQPRQRSRNLSNIFEQKQPNITQYKQNMMINDYAGGMNVAEAENERRNCVALGMYNYPLIGINDSIYPRRYQRISSENKRQSVNIVQDVPSDRLFKFISQFVSKRF